MDIFKEIDAEFNHVQTKSGYFYIIDNSETPDEAIKSHVGYLDRLSQAKKYALRDFADGIVTTVRIMEVEFMPYVTELQREIGALDEFVDFEEGRDYIVKGYHCL